jgi:hypothetical protein
MSPLRIIGPASIEVKISSPVRSRKPVLMKQMRWRAARMHCLRLTVVRRSSSITPIFRVLRASPRRSSISPKTSATRAASRGPCSFGTTT